ncbi:MAG: hypothetical protein CM1200mP3_07120 [Chloroflexota bacterium]|nr:MAG: hypothetical protein CM1200mP3_07120 [Chloroflexota bacterium]
MSRIGNQPIQIPDGVNVNISGSEVTVKGPKGELSGAFSKDIISRSLMEMCWLLAQVMKRNIRFFMVSLEPYLPIWWTE